MKEIESFLDQFEEKVEEKNELDTEEREALASMVPDAQSLGEGLPLLLQKDSDFTENARNADGQVKIWQQTKKMWNTRHEELMKVLQVALRNLNLSPGLKVDNIKLSTSSRTCLEVDEDWLIQMYQGLADAFQKTLPPFIGVKLSVDKNKLGTYLAQDKTLLLNNPEKIHTRESLSTTIKASKR